MKAYFWKYLLFGWLLGAAENSSGQALSGQSFSSGSARKICWQEGKPLTWADFRAKKFPKSAPFNSNNMGAVSATNACFVPITTASGVRIYLMYAVFIQDSSWFNSERIKTVQERAETLAHEQLHFDISELTTRKFRQRLAQGFKVGEDLDGPNVRRDIARLQDEENALNEAFDREVKVAGGHLYEAPVRKRWQQRIARELAALAAYKSTATDCP